MASIPKLRIARPTHRLKFLSEMYAEGLGLQMLGEFHDHEGFDGVMLGHPNHNWHLEFTSSHHPAGKAPTRDNLLVFYYPDPEEWQDRCICMEKAGFQPVKSLNPYWDPNGQTFEDPDGYRVVIQNAASNF